MAISVDPPQKNASLGKRLGLGFPIYSDPQREVIGAWGVADPEKAIALPATFVVAAGGAIRFRHVGQSPPDRPAINQVLGAL